MRFRGEWFADLVIIPLLIVLVVFVGGAIGGAIAHAEGYFAAMLVTIVVGFPVLALYYWWRLFGKPALRRKKAATSVLTKVVEKVRPLVRRTPKPIKVVMWPQRSAPGTRSRPSPVRATRAPTGRPVAEPASSYEWFADRPPGST